MRIKLGHLNRFDVYLLSSASVIGLFCLMFAAMTVGLLTEAIYQYIYGTLIYLLPPSIYGVISSLIGSLRARRGTKGGQMIFVVGAAIGLVTLIFLRNIFLSFNQAFCRNECLLSDTPTNIMFVVSLLPAFVLPLILAYYKWPKK